MPVNRQANRVTTSDYPFSDLVKAKAAVIQREIQPRYLIFTISKSCIQNWSNCDICFHRISIFAEKSQFCVDYTILLNTFVHLGLSMISSFFF